MTRQCSLTTAACKLGATLLSLVSLLLAGACQRQSDKRAEESQPSPSPSATIAPLQGEWGEPTINVCAVLPKEEVAAVQETQVTEVMSVGRPEGDLLISQCVYNAAPPSNSVVASVTQGNPPDGGGRTIQDFWQRTFARADAPKSIPRRKLEGLGDDAYWTGGAIYVLKNEIIVRISVGGPDTDEVKMEKSKLLAERALARLLPDAR